MPENLLRLGQQPVRRSTAQQVPRRSTSDPRRPTLRRRVPIHRGGDEDEDDDEDDVVPAVRPRRSRGKRAHPPTDSSSTSIRGTQHRTE